jgi:hypothetical protein
MWILLMLWPLLLHAAPLYHENCQLFVSKERSWHHEGALLEEAGYHTHLREDMRFEVFPEGALILESFVEDGRCGVFCVKGVVTYHLYRVRKDEEPELIKRVKKGALVPFGQGNKLVDMLKKAVMELPNCVVREDPTDPIGKAEGA